jgi:dihydrofolate reductase
MGRIRVHCLCVSLDGFAAGPDQGPETPLGVGGTRLHEWVFETRAGREMVGDAGGAEGPDSDYVAAGFDGIGATIMGRNMFGPIRGEWGDTDWRGWWGPDPPYHHDVFVMTHHARPPLAMDGGTTFHFVDAPIEAVRERALDAADGQDVRLGGGPATIQQFLRADLVDWMHVVAVPTLLGAGEPLFAADAGLPDRYACTAYVATPAVAHLVIERTG